MEKRKPHYSLELVKKLIEHGKWFVSNTAARNALNDFQLEDVHIKNILLKLNRSVFYKSMTSHRDHRVWQDVYRPLINNIMAYIKISMIHDRIMIVQFKRK